MTTDLVSTIEEICGDVDELVQFWGSSDGWADPETAKYLTEARLDLLRYLAESLNVWGHLTPDCRTNGALILAWANLGAVTECLMKWFIAVYRSDYQISPFATRKGMPLDVHDITFDRLRSFFESDIFPILGNSALPDWLRQVQNQRNIIHVFRTPTPLGSWADFERAVFFLHQFIIELKSCVPMP